MSKLKNIAVILAGGSGSRFGADRPKQLLPLEDGRSVLDHAVEAFRRCACIDEVLVVMHPDWIESPLLSPLREQGVRFVPGGRERWESSWNAIQAIAEKNGDTSDVNILLHDAARPFVSERIISDVCTALSDHKAVTVAVYATDTMYRVSGARAGRGSGESRARVVEIPSRATMMRAQTPQAFRLDLIRHAYELAVQDPNLQATDDCGIVYKYLPDTPICIVEGEETNRKITFKEDL